VGEAGPWGTLLETECPHWPELLRQDGKKKGTFFEKVPTGNRVPSLAQTSLTRWSGKWHFLSEGPYWKQSALTGKNFFDKMVR
jgi:hypothetical protein